MAGQVIPAKSPDIEAWLIASLSPVLAPAIVRNQRPPATLPDGSPNPDAGKPVVVVRASLANHITPISRYCRVAAQAWTLRPDGSPDLPACIRLAGRFGEELVRLVPAGPLLSAEHASGPYRVTDEATRLEYAVINMLLEVAVT